MRPAGLKGTPDRWECRRCGRAFTTATEYARQAAAGAPDMPLATLREALLNRAKAHARTCQAIRPVVRRRDTRKLPAVQDGPYGRSVRTVSGGAFEQDRRKH